MADQKITQLTADASPTTDDLVTTVNDPAGTPANRKVTIANLMNQALVQNPYKFSASLGSAANTGNGAFAIIPFDTEQFDTGGNFDSTSTKGTFTAPIAGYYYFNATANITVGAGGVGIISLYKNGAEAKRGGQIQIANVTTAVNVSALLSLAATDTVAAYSFGSAAYALATGTVLTVFQGYLVSIT